MPGRIFINYRRGDDSAFTQALLARLEQGPAREGAAHRTGSDARGGMAARREGRICREM
jgi:hypothetical protein